MRIRRSTPASFAIRAARCVPAASISPTVPGSLFSSAALVLIGHLVVIRSLIGLAAAPAAAFTERGGNSSSGQRATPPAGHAAQVVVDAGGMLLMGAHLGSFEAMALAESSAFTDQTRTAYHFHTVVDGHVGGRFRAACTQRNRHAIKLGRVQREAADGRIPTGEEPLAGRPSQRAAQEQRKRETEEEQRGEHEDHARQLDVVAAVRVPRPVLQRQVEEHRRRDLDAGRRRGPRPHLERRR